MAKKKLILMKTQIERLKTLNGILLKGTVVNREQIHKLRSEISLQAADNEILDSTASDILKLILSSGLCEKAESAAEELDAARMRFVDVSREKEGIERDLERVVKERDFARRDFEEKRKEMERGHALLLKEKKVVDAKCRKLEEELKSAKFDEDLLKICEEDKNLAEELVREMRVVLSRNDEDLGSLKAENKEKASKISSLEEECRLLEEIREKLENEVHEMKEKAGLVACLLKEKNVVDVRCRKLEEELQSARFNEDLLKRCEEGKNLAEELVREIGVALSQKDEDLGSLKAVNKENASKISTLEEECRLMKEIREKLENEVYKMKEEKARMIASLLKEKKIVDVRCRKLEKELQSVRFNEELLKRCEEGKNLAWELVREMGVSLSQNDEDLGSLKAENKENASKISALEEECHLLKEIRGKLENEVCEMKEENVELVAEIAKFEHLEKEKFDLEKIFEVKKKEMTMQINELKGDITKMAAEKILYNQICANYVIHIGKLQEEISELQSARKSPEDAHRSCSEKIVKNDAISASVQRERDLKTEEIVALKTRLHESMKAKHIGKLKLEQMHKQLNHLTKENVETKKHITSLMDEKSLLETVIETSKQELQVIEKKLETLKDASGQVFALVKNITEEVMDKERTQENHICIESDEKMKMTMENLEVIKFAIKDKDTKINDLNQELELLQVSVACVKNKRAIWKWLIPTTTIFAAVSLAYASSAR